MWILQLSDIHLIAGESYKINYANFLKLMNEKIKECVTPKDRIIVIICGDITCKGNPTGYDLAKIFFQKMKKIFDYDIIFCPCPGNHDISSDEVNYFNRFNKFVWDLTNDWVIKFSRQNTAVCKSFENIDMILLNSAYHGEYTYGLIKLDDLDVVLKNSKSSNKIIITHHNSIPVNINDKSTIANAYGFLQLAIAHEVKAILHGHGHMENILLLGENKCRLIGVGSLFFPPECNLNNQFNLIKYENGSIKETCCCRYVADLLEHGHVGNFQMRPLKEF